MIRKNFYILLIMAITSHLIYAQKDCAVALKAISGSYEGDCKKGEAHGEGKAVGTDTYIGEFRKGEPHGEGKYIWSDGHYYEGEWKKGVKDGKGRLVWERETKEDSVVNGYWEDNEYVGEYLEPYELVSFDGSIINRVQFRKLGTTPRQINLKFNGASATNLNIYSKDTKRSYTTNTFLPLQFPFKASVEAQVPLKSTSTRMAAEFDFNIYEEGSWEVTVFLVDR